MLWPCTPGRTYILAVVISHYLNTRWHLDAFANNVAFAASRNRDVRKRLQYGVSIVHARHTVNKVINASAGICTRIAGGQSTAMSSRCYFIPNADLSTCQRTQRHSAVKIELAMSSIACMS